MINNKFYLKLVALGSVGGELVFKYHQGVGNICSEMRAISNTLHEGYVLLVVSVSASAVVSVQHI